MKKLILLICLIFPVSAFAQHEIRGIIYDVDEVPIKYVTVQCYKANAFIGGTVSNSKGQFAFSCQDSIGRVVISFIGYETKEINTPPSNGDIGKIILKESILELKEVSVVGKNITKILVNKEVYTPSKSDLSISPTSLDLMAKIPGIKVNRISNTIDLLGSDNLLILVNGINRNGNINFNAIEPRNIERVEIISNPSAEFGAEYTAVINVILKKEIEQGFTTNLDLSYMGKDHNGSSIGIDYGLGKFRFFTNYELYYRNHPNDINSEQINISGSDIIETSSKSYTKNPRELGHFVQLGFDFVPHKNHAFNFLYDYKVVNTKSTITNNVKSTMNGLVTEEFEQVHNAIGNYKMHNYSGYYKVKFPNINANATIDANIYRLDFDLNNEYEVANNVRQDYELDKKSSYLINAKYDQKFTDKFSLDLGLQSYVQQISNKYFRDIQESFIYDENRSSAYANIIFSNLGCFNIQLGSRLEHSSRKINSDSTNNRIDIIPNVNILFKLNDRNNFSFNYKRTLVRPGFSQLKPFLYIQDSLNYSQGNPDLEPELRDKLDISYNLKKGNLDLSTSAYIKISNQIIGNSVRIKDNIRYTKFNNIGNGTEYGYDLRLSFSMGKYINVKPFLKLYSQNFEDNSYHNNIHSSEFFVNTEFKFLKNYFGGLEFTIPGKKGYIQGYSLSKPTIDALYVGKPIFKDKAMLMVGFSYPFNNYSIKYVDYFDGYNSTTEVNTDMRIFIVKFMYTFRTGNEIDKISRNLNIENDR